ncbi:MAG TPA: peptidoglycan -binding protein [Burkholderiales bacterium]|nr:peptidoglycan -binding protein [Burkholderiales bacterium]
MFQLARRTRTIDIWPGFVDALASVLLVFIFMLLLFVLAQFYVTWELAGREATISRLQRSINELAATLSLERDRSASLESRLADTEERLRATLAEREELSGRLRLALERAAVTEADLAEARRIISADKDAIKAQLAEIASLQQDIAALRELRAKLEAEIAKRDTELTALRDRSKQLEARLATEEERTRLAQKEIDKRDIRIADLAARVEEQDKALAEGRRLSQRAESRIADLTQQVEALRRQLAELDAALKLAEAKVKDQKVEIEGLGQRLNLALAQKVQELNRYRSEFFGRLREALGDRDDIRIVGDRFVFQSEVLFATGSADLGEPGQQQMKRLAEALKEVSARIPKDIDWVLRVDGHTDRRPIHTQEFPSNWELSVARALSIVRFLIAEGIPPRRLIAAGFGEYHPLDPANTPAAWQRNRRIELRLTLP